MSCTCTPTALDRYRGRVSRALLDRFDLSLVLPRPRAAELSADGAEPSATVRDRVVAARAQLRSRAPLAEAADTLLDRAVERLPLSGRGRTRVLRVARTIAALADAEVIEADHLAEALSYRSPNELSQP